MSDTDKEFLISAKLELKVSNAVTVNISKSSPYIVATLSVLLTVTVSLVVSDITLCDFTIFPQSIGNCSKTTLYD